MLRTATFFKRAVVVGLIAVLAPTVASLRAQPVQSERATPKVQAIVPGDPTTAQGGCDCILDQPPNQENGIFSDLDCDFCGMGPIQILAENFMVIEEGATIGAVRCFGGYFPDNLPPVNAFTVIFYQDVNFGGLHTPGAIISSQSVSAIQTPTGVQLFGVDEYKIDIDLDQVVSLAPGTYWVAVYNDTAGSTDSFFWETGDLDQNHGLPGIASRFTLPTPGEWFFDKTIDLAITLFPPPCPWDLDGGGFVGAGDLLLLLADWGNPYGASDLLALLANWGPCP